MTKQKQKEVIKKYIYKISDMNKIALDTFAEELFTLKHDMDKKVFGYILEAVDMQIAYLNDRNSVSPLVVMGDFKFDEE